MRARLVRPEFWADELMGELSVAVRLTYIGTWSLSDDDGYLEWSPRKIAASLYPYEAVHRRDQRVRRELDQLVAAGRIEVLGCGKHAIVRNIAKYRIKGGVPTYRTRNDHRTECVKPGGNQVDKQERRTTKDRLRSDTLSGSGSGSGSGSVSNNAPGSLDDTFEQAGAGWLTRRRTTRREQDG